MKRYFEFVEGGSRKFWEVVVQEATQTVRFGKLGTEGQEKTKEFDSPSKARAATRKLIAEKTGKGYVEVGGLPQPKRDEKLEAAIEANPDDPAPYLAYARWLESKGDPRGEVIVKHVAKPNDRALLEKHRDYLLGVLASGDGVYVQWQFGVMKTVQIIAFSGAEAADDLDAVLSQPSARFLRELELGLMPDDDAPTLQPCLDLLVKRKAPLTLRSLTLGGEREWEGSDLRTGKIAPLARAFPRLEQLTLNGHRHELGKGVVWPALRALTIGSPGLRKTTLGELLSAKMSRLERLTLWLGANDERGNVTVKDLAPILAGEAFPGLKHLGLIACEYLDELVPALIDSKLLSQLSSLELSRGEVDADALLASKAKFQHLDSFELDDAALAKRLKGRKTA